MKKFIKIMAVIVSVMFFANIAFAERDTAGNAQEKAEDTVQKTSEDTAQKALPQTAQDTTQTQTPLPAAAVSGEKHIVDIQIKGNNAVSTSTILNKLKLKPGDVFEESALNKELKRLYAMGFFSDVFVETETVAEGVVVTFTVVEKPIIESIEFKGAAKIKGPRLQKKVTIQKGDLLDLNKISQDMAAIKAYYVEQGFSNISVNYEVETDPETLKAKLIFVINEGFPIKVRKITVEGNKSIKSGEILNLMATKTAWWFIRKGAFDDETFQADLNRVSAYYRGKGFLDAKVSSKEDYSEDGKSMYITVVVNEGERYLVGDISVKGSLVFTEQEVRKKIKMKTGDPFDYEQIKNDVESVRSLYFDAGYMDAEIDLNHRYNGTTGKMDLEYNITPHDIVYVGKVNIIGNTKTKDKVIRRELRLYPGERYDGEKLKKSKERIYNLGFFEDVYFETVPSEEKDVKDLNVTVKETKTGEFSFGGGYSSIDAFIGFVQVSQKNFDISNFPTFTGGGQNLTARAEMGSSRNNYLLSWTDPWIFGYPYLFGFELYRNEHKRYGDTGYGYDETRTGTSFTLGKEITDYIGTSVVYNIEQVTIGNIPDNATDDLRKEQGTNWISRATWNLGFDNRDNKYSPTKGLNTGISLENAGGFIGGDKDFVKGWVHAAYYHSIIPKVVLELKGRTGVVENYGDSDDVPIYERYFVGGATTVRGYRQRGIGPRDAGTNTALGGEAMAVANTEVTFPLYKNLIKGAVFYDVGNVWENYSDVFTGSEYKQGVGLGVRVKTPIGPVKLDYGYPLNKNYDDEDTGEFYFSVSHGF